MNPWITLRDALRPVRRTPAGGAKEMWIHHGFRALLVLVIGFSVIWIFPGSSAPAYERIQIGSVADQDVIAEFGFEVPKSDEELARERLDARAGVPT
ncbi:MAG: hypothetical protein R3266_10090, partial [Gemmatimonadota bacterium]|nr:hypothetical protein [Gemmatimonadota bacterium]